MKGRGRESDQRIGSERYIKEEGEGAEWRVRERKTD